MFSYPAENFCWPVPWRPLDKPDDSIGFTFEAELQREVSPDHVLYGVECRAVGRNDEDFDEILFTTANPRMPVAFVHLTWTVERTRAFPYTVGYASWEAFHAAWGEGGTG